MEDVLDSKPRFCGFDSHPGYMMCHRKTRWGSYTVVEMGPGYVVKRLEIKAGECISLQFHNYRVEHWVVVGGTGLLKMGTRERQVMHQLAPGSTANIGTGVVHQVKAMTDLRIIEVWRGAPEQLNEDDIERLSYEWTD